MEGVFGTCLVNREANWRRIAITTASGLGAQKLIVYEIDSQKTPHIFRSPLLNT